MGRYKTHAAQAARCENKKFQVSSYVRECESLRDIEARNEALYCARDHDGNVTCDWRALAEVPLDTFKFRNGFSICGKRRGLVEHAEGGLQEASRPEDLESIAEHDPLGNSRCGIHEESQSFLVSLLEALAKKEAILAVDAVSMKQSPCRFWLSVNHCPVGAGQCCETGTACRCKEHRLCSQWRLLHGCAAHTRNCEDKLLSNSLPCTDYRVRCCRKQSHSC